MSTNGDEESSQRVSMPSARLRLRADPFLLACRCFSVLTSLTAILCISVNVLSAVRSFKNESDLPSLFLWLLQRQSGNLFSNSGK
uniref:Uncharacterized protein n=1 Tax=Nelumbo nucifera TaxID=4432 RepID=A0A822XP87_NELNU|nr:TPA_asm: hypothetical protein HUJ06_023580 [Nelumbo nucifera]